MIEKGFENNDDSSDNQFLYGRVSRANKLQARLSLALNNPLVQFLTNSNKSEKSN